LNLAAVEEIEIIAANLSGWTGSVQETTGWKIKRMGLVKGQQISSLLSCLGYALRAQYCLEPRTFVVACPTSGLSSGTIYVVHYPRVNPTPRELYRTGTAANPRCSSIKSTQRSREPPSVHCVITEKAIYFSISGTVHARSCIILRSPKTPSRSAEAQEAGP
jgi:hypothetical protein